MSLSMCVRVFVFAWRRESLAVWLTAHFSPISWIFPSSVFMYVVASWHVTGDGIWVSLHKAPDKSHRRICSSHALQSACFGLLFLPGMRWNSPVGCPAMDLCSRSLGLHCCFCYLPGWWGLMRLHSFSSHFASESQVRSGEDDNKWDSIPPLRELSAVYGRQTRKQLDWSVITVIGRW